MASIEKRTSASGRVTYRVRRFIGGTRDGGRDSETCDGKTEHSVGSAASPSAESLLQDMSRRGGHDRCQGRRSALAS